MKTLCEIYENHRVHGPDQGHGDFNGTHSYGPVFEKLMAPYRAGCNFMEIGLALGLSLAMWREYMPNSLIVGVDLSIVFDPKPHEATGTKLVVCDATKPELLSKIPPVGFDVIVDDGSHMTADQCASFNILKGRMNHGGIYVITDILDIGASLHVLKELHYAMEIYDLRSQKGRFDDVLVVYRF
jgi:hypothetical protein